MFRAFECRVNLRPSTLHQRTATCSPVDYGGKNSPPEDQGSPQLEPNPGRETPEGIAPPPCVQREYCRPNGLGPSPPQSCGKHD